MTKKSLWTAPPEHQPSLPNLQLKTLLHKMSTNAKPPITKKCCTQIKKPQRKRKKKTNKKKDARITSKFWTSKC